jgi:hypothetical protein
VNTWKDAIVITSVGVAGTAIVGWPVLRTLRARTWPHTTATVVHAAVEADGPPKDESTNFLLRFRYEYFVDGKRYECTRLSFFYLSTVYGKAQSAKSFVKHHPRGSALEVHYQPSNPANAVVDVDINWQWWLVLWFAAVFAVGGALPMLRAAFGW